MIMSKHAECTEPQNTSLFRDMATQTASDDVSTWVPASVAAARSSGTIFNRLNQKEQQRQRVMMETNVLDFLNMMATCGLMGEDSSSSNRVLVLQSHTELKEVVLQLYSGAISAQAFLQTAPFPFSLQNSSDNMYWLFLDTVFDALARARWMLPAVIIQGLEAPLQLPNDASSRTGSKLQIFCGELWCRYMQLCVGVWRVAYSSSKFSLPHFNFAVPEGLAAPPTSPTPQVPTPSAPSPTPSDQLPPQVPTFRSVATPAIKKAVAVRTPNSVTRRSGPSIPLDWEEIITIGHSLKLIKLRLYFVGIEQRVKTLQDPGPG